MLKYRFSKPEKIAYGHQWPRPACCRRITTQSTSVKRDTLLCNPRRLSQYNKTHPRVNRARRSHLADSPEFSVVYARANVTPYKLLLYLGGQIIYTPRAIKSVPLYFGPLLPRFLVDFSRSCYWHHRVVRPSVCLSVTL